MAVPQQQSPEDRLKAVRQIGLSALLAIDRTRSIVHEGRGERTLDAIARANSESVGDEAIDSILRSELDAFTKLVNVADRAGLLAMEMAIDSTPDRELDALTKLVNVADRAGLLAIEIEAPLLPEGWMVHETTSARTYSFQGGNAQVAINKDDADPGSMTIKVFGARTWSGYVGESTGYVPLREALKRAEETLADPSSHLSPYGVELVEKAKAEQDKSRAEVVATLRRDASAWAETADRYKNALLGERFMVVDRHERAFSQEQSQIKLELPSAALTGVSFMTKENAEKAREHLERNLADAAPYSVWDFQAYAYKQAGNSTELANLAAAAKWTSGREAKTLPEARELAEVALIRLGLERPESWRESQGSVSPWEYADVDVGGYRKVTVGASAGGVVSLDGDPYTPGDRKVNATLANVERSVLAAQQGLFLAVPLEEIDEAPFNRRDAGESLSDLLNEKYEGMNDALREFVDRVSEGGKISRNLAVIVTDKLGESVIGRYGKEFAAVHVTLAEVDLEDGLTVQQKAALKALESDFWEKYVPDVTPEEPMESGGAYGVNIQEKNMTAINIRISTHYVLSAKGETLAEAVENALRDKQVIEAKNLGGTAGYKWHGLSVSPAEQVIERFNGIANPRQLWNRTITAQWEAMQTLPQERSGEQNPVKEVKIKIEHGPEFAAEPAIEWKNEAGKLVASSVYEIRNHPLAGAMMRLNREARMAEVVLNDGHVIGFGGVPAITDWVEENGISKEDAKRLYELDAQGSRREELSEEAKVALARMDDVDLDSKASGFVVLSITETGNAAFVDVGRNYEVARIIEEAAGKIQDSSSVDEVDFSVRDTNGNTVGHVSYTETVPTGEPEAGAVRLAVATGNAAFEESGTEEVARILQEAAGKVRGGEHIFALRDINGQTVGKFEFREEPSLDKDGVIDMNEALNSGRVYLGEDGFSGIADGEYRYVVTTPDFEPGYGQGEGDVWLVNAKGEIAPGYEEPQSVREMLFRELKRDEKSDLRAVVEGRATFEDFERRFSGEEPELG